MTARPRQLPNRCAPNSRRALYASHSMLCPKPRMGRTCACGTKGMLLAEWVGCRAQNGYRRPKLQPTLHSPRHRLCSCLRHRRYASLHSSHARRRRRMSVCLSHYCLRGHIEMLDLLHHHLRLPRTCSLRRHPQLDMNSRRPRFHLRCRLHCSGKRLVWNRTRWGARAAVGSRTVAKVNSALNSFVRHMKQNAATATRAQAWH